MTFENRYHTLSDPYQSLTEKTVETMSE